MLFLIIALVLGDAATTRAAAPEGMAYVPAQRLIVGSDDTLPEEAPAHEATVEALYVDDTEVTNAEFAAFVEETGYVTVAERQIDPADFPGADPALLVPGSVVFTPPTPGSDPATWQQWWSYVPGAQWRHPGGPDTTIEGCDDEPVVHVAYEDAVAYANWAEKRLPTEAEWEAMARGGLVAKRYAWGDERTPDGRYLANFWQGNFPAENDATDGYPRLAPVGRYPPNGYGLYDVTGNVWEWTSTPWTPDHRPGHPPVEAARVIKGGSFLCADSYCHRYRPAARTLGAIDTGTSHLGFRCVRDAG